MKHIALRTWRFSHKDAPSTWQKDFDDSDWERVTVPHDWSVHEPFDRHNASGTGYLNGGIGWYRGHFSLKQLTRSDHDTVILRFAGAYRNSDVWVNGYHLGGRPSGYAEFSFDVTDLLTMVPDDDLVVAVRLDREELADSRWFNGTGLNRPVTLEVHAGLMIPDYGTVFTTPAVSKTAATVKVSHQVRNNLPGTQLVTVTDTLTSQASGKQVTLTRTEPVASGETKTMASSTVMQQPELWSVDQPTLYTLRTTLTSDDLAEEASYEQTVGIRSADFDPDTGFHLNGEPLKLKGVCLHEDAGVLGTAVPQPVWTRRLLALKAMGANAIRMSHNPHTPALYDLCDALGFLVFDEAFDEWENPKNKWWQGHNVYPPKFGGYSHDFPHWHKADLTNMVQRDRNHPSVIAWSIGNEVDYPNDPYANPLFKEMTGNNDANKPAAEREYNPNRPDTKRLSMIATELAHIVKANDPTRPVTLAAAFPELSAKTGLLAPLDVVGYNYKEHLYAADHARFPDKPFVGSENSHSFAAWRVVTDNDYVAGQFLWTGIDYLGEAHGWPIHGSGAGLLTLAGFPKTNYYLRQSWWAKSPVLKMVTAPAGTLQYDWEPLYRRWDYADGTAVTVRFYTNCQDLQVRLGGKPVATPVYDSEHGYYEATLTYTHAALTVTGTTPEGTTLTDTLVPTGAPAQLQAHVWQDPTTATTQDTDVYQVEYTLADNASRATAANAVVRVAVHGGTLLGLENGNLADNTDYSADYRRTADGCLIAYVRSADPAHTTVTATTSGLPAATISLQ
ncbi:glycoside hydrolase family 2 [Schleiferilactobacillus shenzhenensis]|uniref:Uncharacterized protein n=1 Tax=Schleiferilactobacillus shenzhenensis LY-73 TaxID=1231336 RepID=U4TJ93_9LACO|nr:glycoside hydrolase family 2 [Schleiferilactobacillus shenzhenensis]ERL64284.1 hypothetical protein L248_1052 [Schleiferilactobacillus shenzhenensis LY-73]